MFMLFLICALLGGTVFLCQFVMAIIGFGAEELELADDVPDDIPDSDVGDTQGDVLDHGSTWLFGVLSFRTIVAALTFFGLGGMAMLDATQSMTPIASSAISVIVALSCGVVAMYGVHYVMRLLYRARHDGTVRIEYSLGKRGTVYVPIPAGNAGTGKIHVHLPGGVREYAAVTNGDTDLATGSTVEITAIVDQATLEVAAVDTAAKAVVG